MKCVICQNTIIPLEPTGVLCKEQPKIKICSKCDKAKKGLLNIERGEVNASKAYFEKYFSFEKMNESVKEQIELWIKSADSKTIQKDKEKYQSKEAEKIYYENRKDLLKFVTTANNFEGYKIVDYYGVVSGEIVIGTGFLSELDASISDFFGEKSISMSKKIADAKIMAQEAMVKNAAAVGGNAVIAIDFDIITFNNNLIGIFANGTAVKIEKMDDK